VVEILMLGPYLFGRRITSRESDILAIWESRLTHSPFAILRRSGPQGELAPDKSDDTALLVKFGLVGAVVVGAPQHVELARVPLRVRKVGVVAEEARLHVRLVEEGPVARDDVEVGQFDPGVLHIGPARWVERKRSLVLVTLDAGRGGKGIEA